MMKSKKETRPNGGRVSGKEPSCFLSPEELQRVFSSATFTSRWENLPTRETILSVHAVDSVVIPFWRVSNVYVTGDFLYVEVVGFQEMNSRLPVAKCYFLILDSLVIGPEEYNVALVDFPMVPFLKGLSTKAICKALLGTHYFKGGKLVCKT